MHQQKKINVISFMENIDDIMLISSSMPSVLEDEGYLLLYNIDKSNPIYNEIIKNTNLDDLTKFKVLIKFKTNYKS